MGKKAADPAPLRRLAAQDALLPLALIDSSARGAVVDAALRLFAERGYGGTSVRDIAAAVGVQPASLYAHFPSKEHVLAAICQMGHQEFVDGLRAAMLESQPDPRHQIAAYMRAHVRFHGHYSMLAVVCNSEMHMLSPQLGGPVLALRKQGEELLLSIIRRGGELGVFCVPHLWLAAAMIGGPGLRVANWYMPDFELTIEEIAEVYVRFAWRILGVPEDWGARNA